MTSDTPEQPELSGAAAPSADAAPAPKKRTRSRKPAVQAEASVAAEVSAEPVAEVAAAQTASPEPVAEKPARTPRKPRTRKTAAPVPSEGAEDAPPTLPQVAADLPVVAAAPEPAPQPAPEVTVADAAAQGPASAEPVTEVPAKARRSRRRTPAQVEEVAASAAPAAEPAPAVALSPEATAQPPSPPLFTVETPPDVQAVFASVLAGEFDAEAEELSAAASADAPEKRVLAPDVDAPKLHKVLAQSGIGSRRDMEQVIQDGRVTVNGEVAHTGMRISFGDRVAIDGKPVRVRIAPPPPRVIAYHKPAGEVVTHDDPQQRPTVFRKLPRLSQGKWQSVGRLDMNTEGLLLFTNSGDLANKLMHPRFGVEREYAVRVLGTLEKEARERLLAGVEIEGQAAAFKSIEDGGGEGVNHWYRVVITEGRNREVRKLFDAVGLTVSRLIRIRYGCVVLPRGLRRGVCVDLGEADVKALRQLTGGRGQERGGERGPERERGAERGESGGNNRRRESASGRDNAAPRRPAESRGESRGERGDRSAERPPRTERPERGPRPEAGPKRGGDRGGDRRGERRERDRDSNAPSRDLPREPGDPSRIPNPLQQTYDRRAIQRERSGVRDEDDFENGPIPNPLQQTYDKRFVQNTRGGGGGKGGKGGAPRQPDPMQTSVGYIGADAFTRKLQGGRGGGRRGGGGR